MSADKPVPIVHILHGDDDFEMDRYVQKLTAGLGNADPLSMNLTHLDGKSATLEDILTAAATVSFFDTSKRLVVLTNPLAKYGKDKAARERFLAMLNSLPPLACLVMLVSDVKSFGDWKLIPAKKSHWLKDWIEKSGGRAVYRPFEPPRFSDMPGLISKQAKDQNGSITPDAARALAAHTGSNPRMASQEVTKLLTYVNYSRPVEVKDVENLCVGTAPVSIFELTDALGSSQIETAMRMLHTLLEQEEAMMIFSMVVAHFRSLLLTREVMDEGGNARVVAKELEKPEFMAEKLCRQAAKFPISELEAHFIRLCEFDLGIKTGELSADLALDLFAAGLEKTGR